MDVLTILISFTIIAAVISVAVDNLVVAIKYATGYETQKYKLSIAIFMALILIFGYNIGILQELGIVDDTSILTLYHYTDLVLSAFIIGAGARSIHQLQERIGLGDE